MVLTAAAKPPRDVIKLRSFSNHGNKLKPNIRVLRFRKLFWLGDKEIWLHTAKTFYVDREITFHENDEVATCN